MPDLPPVLTFHFKDDGIIPNHPSLPLVVYKQAVPLRQPDPGAEFERLFAGNSWRAAWRWGVYDFPHYHSTAHEVLGVFRGTATLQVGGAQGVRLVVEAGDAIVIPAGVGHQNLGCSADFQVVGGYPLGQTADLCRGLPGERPPVIDHIVRVPLPAGDPLFGANGPLREHWRA
jgi:uncharacterized protein YjlB